MQGQQPYQHQLFHYFNIESLIPSNHLLRKREKHVNLNFVNELTEPFYCLNNGRPSIAPELFFRMIIIGYLHGIESDRQLCEEIQYNLAYRLFCSIDIEKNNNVTKSAASFLLKTDDLIYKIKRIIFLKLELFFI